jgi:hypothetical protein
MDLPYLVFDFLLLFLSYIFWKTKKSIFATWAFVVAFVFFAFRAPVVGADTWNYVRYLTGERNFYNDDIRPIEPFFVIYREIISSFTSSRFVVMVINTLVSLAPLYYITKRYSLNPPLTILFFIFLEGMSIYFCALRQIIALAILYIALIYWLQEERHPVKRFFVFSVCIIIAYFFHTSSVLYSFILVIALIPFKFPRFLYIGITVGTAMIGILLEKFNVLDLFSLILGASFSVTERLEAYLMDTTLNDAIQLSILLRMSIISLIVFFYIPKEKLSHPFSKIFLAEVIIFNLLFSIPMVHRICFPLSIFGAIIITWGWEKSVRMNLKHMYFNIIMVLVILYFMRAQIIQASSWDKYDQAKMHPYYFIFEDYSHHPVLRAY